jgi:hypothetical protein
MGALAELALEAIAFSDSMWIEVTIVNWRFLKKAPSAMISTRPQ